jgi:flavin-dependent dehydrogenase
MLMALESAEILAETVAENFFSPETAAEKYAVLHRRKFGGRLRICSVMRRLAFAPAFAGLMIFALGLSEKPREILARATRRSNTKIGG